MFGRKREEQPKPFPIDRCGRLGPHAGRDCRWDIAESGEIKSKPDAPQIDGHFYELRCRVCGWMIVRDLDGESREPRK